MQPQLTSQVLACAFGSLVGRERVSEFIDKLFDDTLSPSITLCDRCCRGSREMLSSTGSGAES